MVWVIILVVACIILLAILGGMGFFDSSESDNHRHGGTNFIDWFF